MKTELTFAVLIDAENASHNDYLAMLEEVENHGTVAIKWVYADWTDPHQKAWKDILHETASSPKQQFHYGKDAADHALMMDAIEVTNNNSRVNAVCIVSSDGGFYSVAQRIREYGIHVMAIGKKNTPERFRKACHNFVFIDNLFEVTQNNNDDLDTLLLNAYHRCVEQNTPVYLGDMGRMIKQINSSFDPRTEGFQSLKKLIKSRSSLFDIVQESNDRCFIALKFKSATDGSHTLTGKVRKWERKKKFGFIKSNDGDYYFNARELQSSERDIREGITVTFNAANVSEVRVQKDSASPSAFNVVIA
ncbi:MAG: NYN domain-containing protein [Moritella sp.]|uniref:NYN domain-containing protein n=1 Tax=Moritella sp. TaxID=78556 RepID=UPI002600D8C5|nr:NYN domain-containing protein [Moritella sp.]NQZ93549.1 NYN domain-containing protein [Moritella sp.]